REGLEFCRSSYSCDPACRDLRVAAIAAPTETTSRHEAMSFARSGGLATTKPRAPNLATRVAVGWVWAAHTDVRGSRFNHGWLRRRPTPTPQRHAPSRSPQARPLMSENGA